jgi:hypothetical protein
VKVESVMSTRHCPFCKKPVILDVWEWPVYRKGRPRFTARLSCRYWKHTAEVYSDANTRDEAVDSVNKQWDDAFGAKEDQP